MKKSFDTLLDARETLGLTQQEMANLLGISRNYVSMIELGKKPFSAKLKRKFDKVSTPQDANFCHAVRESSDLYGASAARIAELETELATARQTIHNLSIALASARLGPGGEKGGGVQ